MRANVRNAAGKGRQFRYRGELAVLVRVGAAGGDFGISSGLTIPHLSSHHRLGSKADADVATINHLVHS